MSIRYVSRSVTDCRPFIPRRSKPPAWRATFKPEGAPAGDANLTAADAFLEAANRLREASPRQDLPPVACAVELAERQARVAGKAAYGTRRGAMRRRLAPG